MYFRIGIKRRDISTNLTTFELHYSFVPITHYNTSFIVRTIETSSMGRPQGINATGAICV